MQNIVCFSGGSACNSLSVALAQLEHTVSYVITTFDSGRSTGVLREYFGIPAVGDIRNRMLAIAPKIPVNIPILALLQKRFSAHITQKEQYEFHDLLNTTHVLWHAIPDSHAKQQLLSYATLFKKKLLEHRPLSSSLTLSMLNIENLSYGNCILAGALWFHNSLTAATQALSGILAIRDTILPVCEQSLSLQLNVDTLSITEQSAITKAPITEHSLLQLNFVPYKKTSPLVNPCTTAEVIHAIQNATLILYPMGSFLTSICASILPTPIAQTIAQSTAIKCYIPNVGYDNEHASLSVTQRALTLVQHLQRMYQAPLEHYLNVILIDDDATLYHNGIEEKTDLHYYKVHNLATRQGHNVERIISALQL